MMVKKLEISFREYDRGGGLLDEPSGFRHIFESRSRLILLVHGYNVSKQEAQSGYEQFKDIFHKKGEGILAKQLGEVFWPGDEQNKVKGTLLFASKIPVAIKTGFRLENYLNEVLSSTDGPMQLVLIGHSLGCRVILETLANMVNQRRKKRDVFVFLMAPGVPVQMVESGERLRPAVQYTRAAYTFCSIGDEALLVFPIGQKMAREPNLTKFEAVGQYGNPIDAWTWVYRDDSYWHGDYWKSPEVVEKILRHLGRPSSKALGLWALPKVVIPPERPLKSRPDPTYRQPPTRDNL